MSDYADQTVAVLAIQGAFAEHEARLSELGARCIELRQAADLKQDFDRLVLPGGESTVQGKLLDELGMLEELRARIAEGMPVLGTCAGLILLARDLAAHDDKARRVWQPWMYLSSAMPTAGSSAAFEPKASSRHRR